MKNTLLIIGVFALFSCTKNNKEGVVIKDCTGTYIEIGNLDYRVCNVEITDAFAEGTEVEIDFRKVRKCEAQDSLIRCELFHEYVSTIKIKSLKTLFGNNEILE